MVGSAEILPSPLRWAVWLLRAEAVALGVVAGYVGLITLNPQAQGEDLNPDLTAALLLTAIAAGAALVLWLLGRALAARRAAARAPAIVLQLMLLGIGYYMATGGLAWLGLPLIALGLVVCGLLLSPSTTRGLGLH